MLRKTVLSLESPTGAFIAPLRCANANLFNKVQEKLAKNKKAPARHKAEESYLLTTKLYCGKCGALMFGESGVSHTGKMYTYYKCAAAKKKKTCDKKAVRKQWLEDLVVNETMKLVEDDASMDAIIAKVMELQNQESTDLPIYEKQLKETEVGITNMLNAIQMGILTSSTKERLEELDAQSLLDRMAQMEQEGTTFMNKQKQDTRRRRFVAPIVVAIVMSVLMAGLIWLFLWAFEVDPAGAPPLPVLALFVAIPAAVVVGVVIALVQRVREIERGEEDDARNY